MLLLSGAIESQDQGLFTFQKSDAESEINI